MSFKRPAQVPRWAWGGSATLVQPPSGSAEAGFATRDEPPAQWFNWLFNAYGGWVDFLRGPGVERWTRHAWGGSLDAPSKIPFDVETATSDEGQTSSAFRYALVGENSSPSARMWVSQAGSAWVERSNMPSSGTVTGPFALKALSGRWLLGCLTSLGAAAIYYTAADDGTGTGAVGGAGGSWTSATMPASPTEVKSFARLGSGNVVAACATRAIYSTDSGATWNHCTFATTPTGDGRDVAVTATKYVWVSQDGEVFTSGDGATFTSTTSLAAGSGTWQLAAGDTATGTGEVVAWRVGQSTSVDLYRSTDSGVSFAAVTQTDAPKRITSLRWAEGVWIATSTRAPWVWVSNDLTSWRSLSPPVDSSSLSPALYAVAWDGGAWTAIGNGFALLCDRAADPADGLYVALDTPATLADAGSLRGRLLSTTAPTSGQVLAWNSGTSRWTPTTIATSSSPTTTRGDIIRRGASADERLALGTSGYVLSSDGTDVVWVKTPGPWETFTSGGVTTTDDTTTTCGSTYAPTAGGHFVEIHVRAETSDLATCAAWVVRAHVKNVSSTVTISGSGGGDVSVDGPVGDAVAWTVALDVSGGAVRLRVTGALATTIDWTARWTIR